LAGGTMALPESCAGENVMEAMENLPPCLCKKALGL